MAEPKDAGADELLAPLVVGSRQELGENPDVEGWAGLVAKGCQHPLVT